MNRLSYVTATVTVIIVSLIIIIIVLASYGQTRSYTTSRGYAVTELNFETIDNGIYSGIDESLYTSLRSKSDFETFWIKHSQGTYPPPDIPTVDFQLDMVVSVFSGERSSGGYDIEVKFITETDSEIVIHSETTVPCPLCMVTFAITQPFHIVKLKASTKHVRFETVETPMLPVPYPVFTLSFESEVEGGISNVVNEIENYESVKEVEVLKDIKFIFVYFDEEKIDRCAAKKNLGG